ncbi:MAG TPA: TOBE-like domain-containing protein, partial [Candidatus Competibacteraceae bacterium]|nr:TOBE-like domain-containing protein [Candidatus Competibacteraceae bacterium]
DDEQGLVATVAQVRALGPIVRIELVFEGGRIQVELTRERYQADPLQVGETIRIRPRRLQVFPAEQAAETATGTEE